MRIIYDPITLEISTIELNDQSITAFPGQLSCLQVDESNALIIAITIGLDAGKIIKFAEDNNIIINMTQELQQVLKDRAFGQHVLNEFLAENKNMNSTLEQDLAMLNTFQPIKQMLEIGAINRAYTLWQDVTVDSVITQGRKDKFNLMLSDYLGL